MFSGINSNCSQSTGHCTCIFTVAISKPYSEDWGLQKSRIRFIETKYLSIPIGITISTVSVHKSQHLHNAVYIDCSMIMVAISVWALATPYAYWRVDISLPVSSHSLAGQTRRVLPRDYSSLPSFFPLFLPILPLHSPSTRWTINRDKAEMSQQHPPCLSSLPDVKRLKKVAWWLGSSLRVYRTALYNSCMESTVTITEGAPVAKGVPEEDNAITKNDRGRITPITGKRLREVLSGGRGE